jgi:hypothetical protein
VQRLVVPRVRLFCPRQHTARANTPEPQTTATEYSRYERRTNGDKRTHQATENLQQKRPDNGGQRTRQKCYTRATKQQRQTNPTATETPNESDEAATTGKPDGSAGTQATKQRRPEKPSPAKSPRAPNRRRARHNTKLTRRRKRRE